MGESIDQTREVIVARVLANTRRHVSKPLVEELFRLSNSKLLELKEIEPQEYLPDHGKVIAAKMVRSFAKVVLNEKLHHA